MRICVATKAGLYVHDVRAGSGTMEHEGASVTGLARADTGVWAVLDRSQLWQGAGADPRHVTDLEGLRVTCLASIDGELWVGTSEARLFRLADGGLEAVAAFDAAEGRDTWYTPWGGPPDTRSIANWDEDTYVNVHVGGILHSRDHGETWTPTIDIDADVHQVTTAEGLVLAASAGGLATSADDGATWSMRTEGLAAHYARAVAVCGDSILLSSSNGPRGGRAALYRAGLTDGAFERCEAGPGWFDANIDSYCLDALPEGGLAAFGTSDGSVYLSLDGTATWSACVTGLAPVQRLLVMP